MSDERTEFKNLYGDTIKIRFTGETVFRECVIDSQSFHFDKWLWSFLTAVSLLISINLMYPNAFKLSIVCFILAVLLAVLKLNTKVKKESLRIVKTMGAQITTEFLSGRKSSKFIAWESIQDIIINEAVTMHQCLFYLAILLKSGHGNKTTCILPVFQHTLPRLDCLKEIYRSFYEIINK